MKIALVVPGRFHGFDLARALLGLGYNVTVLTNYPKWAVAHFGVSGEHVRSLWVHGLLGRFASRLHPTDTWEPLEVGLHSLYGRWALDELSKQKWDIVHLWSGVAEEVLRSANRGLGRKLLMRGSAHIRTQARLLDEEMARTKAPLDRPSPWMIAREEREYALADEIVVLSSFAYQSFVDQGVPADKLRLLPLGALLDAFRPSPTVVAARCARVLSGEPLRILYVGALSFQKGLWDLATAMQWLGKRTFQFRLVGPRFPETQQLLIKLDGVATIDPKRPQAELPQVYSWADVFVFPTIQDGYAQVLAQAAASGLPLITTTNCAGPDLVREGETGWVLPIRCPEAIVERLQWCNSHRAELAAMAQRIPAEFQPRDWADVAADFERICVDSLNVRHTPTLEGN